MKRTPINRGAGFKPRTAALRKSDGKARAEAQVFRPKKCKACTEPFTPARPLQKVCSAVCAQFFARLANEKNARAELRKAKDNARPKSYWLDRAQKAVNLYVRLRDHRSGCISCEKPPHYSGMWTGSHFRSVGAASGVRFNLWNIHKACGQCNLFLSGNIAAYEPNLRHKIGEEKLEWLKSQNKPVTYEVEYLRRVRSVFMKKAKRLERRLK